MEYVIDRLSGKTGLKNDARVRAIRAALSREGKGANRLAPAGVEQTLDYLRRVVARLPDQGFAVAFRHKLDRIIDGIGKTREAEPPAGL
jgi:polyphosphate kinase 2 (PPK2 family)